MADSSLSFGSLESRLYEVSIEVTGHKRYYELFFSQVPLLLPETAAVLDAGCGGGLLAIGLLKECHRRTNRGIIVHAFDISPFMLHIARRNATKIAAGDNLKIYCANGRETCFQNNSFDLVMSSGMLEYIPEPGEAIKEIARVLKPSGQLMLSFVKDNALGYSASRLWNFKVLTEAFLREQLYGQGIRDLKEFKVNSHNLYMRALKGIWLGRKTL